MKLSQSNQHKLIPAETSSAQVDMEIVAVILLHPISQEKILPIIHRKFSDDSAIKPYFHKGLREAWSYRRTIIRLAPDVVCICIPQITSTPRTSFLRALSLSYRIFGGRAFLVDEQGVISRCSLFSFIVFDIPKLVLDLLVGVLTILLSYIFIFFFRLYLFQQRNR